MQRKRKSTPWIETHPADRFDLGKPAPVFNTSLNMQPDFSPMVHDLMREFGLSQQQTIETLLKFCATTVDYASVKNFFRAQA